MGDKKLTRFKKAKLIGWGICWIVFLFAMISTYQSLSNHLDDFMSSFETYPEIKTIAQDVDLPEYSFQLVNEINYGLARQKVDSMDELLADFSDEKDMLYLLVSFYPHESIVSLNWVVYSDDQKMTRSFVVLSGIPSTESVSKNIVYRYKKKLSQVDLDQKKILWGMKRRSYSDHAFMVVGKCLFFFLLGSFLYFLMASYFILFVAKKFR